MATQTAADTIQRLLAVTLPNGGIRVAKTGTSHGRQDALAVLVTKHHLIVVWFGTPDHEPTEVLTGVHVALPFAEQLQAALGLDDPVIVLRTTELESPGAVVPSCPRLIDFPESGEWIRTDDNHIAVCGTGRDLAWFLDGIAVTVDSAGISVPTGGAYRVTAAAGECRETVEVFVELVDSPPVRRTAGLVPPLLMLPERFRSDPCGSRCQAQAGGGCGRRGRLPAVCGRYTIAEVDEDRNATTNSGRSDGPEYGRGIGWRRAER